MRVAAAITLVLAAGCLEAPPESPPDPGGDAVCPILLDEPFEALDPDRWDLGPEVGGAVDVAGGRLSLSADPDTGDGYGYIDATSVDEWDLAGLTVTAEVEISWSGDGFGDAALVLEGPNGYLGLIADSSVLSAVVDEEYLCDPDPCARYSIDDHRFWRIRESEGDLHFETSPEGDDWSEVAPPQPTPPGAHVIVFWSECGEGNGTEMDIDRVTVECNDG